MTDLSNILGDLDLSAVPVLNDKINECHFFYELLSNEYDRSRFRWLLGAFLNSCYGYLEDKASYLHYARCDHESGEPIEDEQGLETLRKHVQVFKHKKTGFIKTTGFSELMKVLYKYRNKSTHDGGIGILIVGDNLPTDFHIGIRQSEGIPALELCMEVLSLFSVLES
jgi:hypothetical protein